MARWAMAGLIASASVAIGCAGSPAAAIAQPPSYEPSDQAKCKVSKSSMEPLIIEWPAAERAKLEALASRGIVAVRYEGCEMEVLPRCSAVGAYAYFATTRQRERVQIRDADELYAELPLGAIELEGELARKGELAVELAVVGTFSADEQTLDDAEVSGACEGATHLIASFTAGAFVLTSGASATVGGGVAVGGIGKAGGGSSAEQSILREAGRLAACEESAVGDIAPPDGCGALVRVEVVPIPKRAAPIAHVPPPPPIEPGPTEHEPTEPAPSDPDPGEPTAGPDPVPPAPPAEAAPPPAPEPTSQPADPPPVDSPMPPEEGHWYESAAFWVPVGAIAIGVVVGVIVAATHVDPVEAEVAPAGLGTAPVGATVLSW